MKDRENEQDHPVKNRCLMQLPQEMDGLLAMCFVTMKRLCCIKIRILFV